MTDAELRALLADCLILWGVRGKAVAGPHGVAVETPSGVFAVTRAEAALRPARWFYQTPARAAAGRPPRAVPSITGLLSALRNMVLAGG